jgi:hypothetical protein
MYSICARPCGVFWFEILTFSARAAAANVVGHAANGPAHEQGQGTGAAAAPRRLLVSAQDV